MSYTSIIGQTSMALDKTRNKIYQAALKDVVTPNSVVLDLGAGLGPFGLMAAKLGAKKVYLVEPQNVIRTVKNVVKINNLQDIVECIQGHIEEIELPEKVDIITSCFTGNFLLSEDLLPSLFYARDKFLKSDGILLPDSGSMYAVPINAPKSHKEKIAYLSKPHLGIDYSFYRKHAANHHHHQRNLGIKNYLAKPKLIQTIDFTTASTASCDHSIEFKINKKSTCHGFLGWFDMTLGKQSLSTAPDAPFVHWSPLSYLIDPPLKLEAGSNLSLTVKKSSGKPWAWVMNTENEKRIHSAFFANARQSTKRDQTKKIALKAESQILLLTLQTLNQDIPVSQIINRLCKRWPKEFNTNSAKKYVLKIIQQHSNQQQ